MWLPSARIALSWWSQRAALDQMRSELTAHWIRHRASLESDVIEIIIRALGAHGRIDCCVDDLRKIDLGNGEIHQ